MVFIQHNLLALNAERQLNINTRKNQKTTEKLSSGYKINRAADDAAGLAISEKMRRQVRGLHQGAENIKDGIGYVQTAEGALNEVHDMLQRINELAVKAASETNTDVDREYIDSEIQALKKEMDRIFDTTTFNERKIWDYGEGEKDPVVGYRYEDAVTFKNSSTSIPGGVTNANCGVLAVSRPLNPPVAGMYSFGYEFEADDAGVRVKWIGYDGNSYQTETVKWKELEDNNYSFKMEDYFGAKDANNKLYTYNAATGDYEPVFTKTVSFNVNALAKKPENKHLIKETINNAKMTASAGARMYVHDDDCNLLSSKGEVYVHSPQLNYAAAYLSWANSSGTDGHDFDKEDDDFIVPKPPNNLKPPSTDSDRWTFTFEMEGIGKVTAASTTVEFHSNDSGYYETEDKDVWWRYVTVNGKQEQWPTYKSGTGNLQGLKAGLTGDKNGLLSRKEKLGWSDRDGYITLNFTLTPENKNLTYGTGTKLTSVGSFSIHIPVYNERTPHDTVDTVLQRINTALNGGTTLDFRTTGKNDDSASIGEPRGVSSKVKIPVYPPGYVPVPYDDTQDFFVQAGAEAGQHISIKYEFLSVKKLGMEDTNVLTAESAGKAIDEVKGALKIVSEQRSLFGAYQNRLDHAYNINTNVEENTQSAESVIRDTDIADAMMEFSINNILLQAGTSMLTQANQSSQSILELLQ